MKKKTRDIVLPYKNYEKDSWSFELWGKGIHTQRRAIDELSGFEILSNLGSPVAVIHILNLSGGDTDECI
ncbi:MAG: hypothetical protein HXS47_09770 [Theionarchaea archaeon]|nr:hypothetical protein [Theionarchaea archaeon]